MRELMEAAVLHAPGDLRVETVLTPGKIGGKEVLVKVRAAGICGSDIDRIMKTGTYSFPTIPGHEFCGEIEETGREIDDYKKGDRVLVVPLLPCFRCEFCRQGNFGLCDDYNYLGSRTDGGFARFVKAPARNLIRLPDEVSFRQGACIEPAAVTLHGIKKINVSTGDTVAVIGCGTLGLFAVQLAKISGSTRVIAIDIASDKLELADLIGADETVNAAESDPVESVKRITGNRGVDVAVEAAGSSRTQDQCLRITKKNGNILYLGTVHSDVVIPRESSERIVRYELTIKGAWNSCSAPFPGTEWHDALEYVKKGSLKIDPLITHEFELKEAPRVFSDLANKKYSFTKVIFKMN